MKARPPRGAQLPVAAHRTARARAVPPFALLPHRRIRPCRTRAAPNRPRMQIRLRQHKRIVMGRSTCAGWGAFLHGDAQKGDFLGEYTGDLIDHVEADRRGRVYDKINNSCVASGLRGF